MNSFLNLLAKDLMRRHDGHFENLTVLFPNKRAGLFLARELASLTDRPLWMPEILTLGEFIERQTDLKQADDLTLIIKLYKAYLSCSGSNERFDDFYFWGNMLLGDFDDIDKYLVNARALFSNLVALQEIEDKFPYLSPGQIDFIRRFWSSFHPEKFSREQEEFLKVWDKLHPTYETFKRHLAEEKLCYEGMGQRLFASQLTEHHTDRQLIFAGFNALNQCEKKIFSYFRDNRQALFYWDYDLYYSTDENHEAGLYIRENMKLFPNALGIEHFNNFRHNGKSLEYISTPSVIGQAKLIPTLLEQMRPSGKKGHTDTAIVLESLRGLDEILQYGAGPVRLAGLDARSEALAADEARLKRSTGRATALTGTVLLACDLAMLLAAAALYQAGAVGFDGVLVPVLTLMGSFGPVVALAGLGSTLQGTLAAGNRALDVLDEEPVTPEVTGEKYVGFDGAAAERVGFSYGDARVLDGVSLAVRPGEVVGVSGRSGSGKSTLLRLFMRFWDADEGTVRVSGRDVRRVNTANLRDLESLVTQETHLFRDSIRNNLRIARLDATDAEIEEACRKASVHDFIASLPAGYDTQVGELGETLSGGERQRLGLARAFLHDAPFLLLDEPTSNLDALNEGVILRSINEERAGRTVLLVSHRPSTMRIADRVICVEDGRVS